MPSPLSPEAVPTRVAMERRHVEWSPSLHEKLLVWKGEQGWRGEHRPEGVPGR
jgi:hypothetical protein